MEERLASLFHSRLMLRQKLVRIHQRPAHVLHAVCGIRTGRDTFDCRLGFRIAGRTGYGGTINRLNHFARWTAFRQKSTEAVFIIGKFLLNQ